MTRSRYDLVLKWVLITVGIIIVLTVIGLFDRQSGRGEWRLTGGPRIGLIEITGVILDSRAVVRRIDELSRRKDIDAILVRIESPGGAVAASQEIYMKLAQVRDEGDKPVVASMGNVAASGGVYLAMGVDTIMANPGTATGSIGVILDYIVAENLMKKLGLSVEVVKSGPLKDAGSPYRAATEQDRAIFQSLIDDLYEQFIETVALERNLPLEEVRKMATGQIYTGRQAQKLGLIDLLGSYEDAVNLAGQMTGSDKRPEVVRPVQRRRRTLLDLILGNLASQILNPQLMPQFRLR
ncbi:MAG: signal peptide peptidase SppA [Candidatus Marinimicrobia bacterium]|nr:signal peptide peptidase SppA [Candidatus Neomarinimicrobiota bacterium]